MTLICWDYMVLGGLLFDAMQEISKKEKKPCENAEIRGNKWDNFD